MYVIHLTRSTAQIRSMLLPPYNYEDQRFKDLVMYIKCHGTCNRAFNPGKIFNPNMVQYYLLTTDTFQYLSSYVLGTDTQLTISQLKDLHLH